MKPHHHLYTLILYFAIQDLRHWIKTNYVRIINLSIWLVLIPIALYLQNFKLWFIIVYLIVVIVISIMIARTKVLEPNKGGKDAK
jgi:hypothetical protein